MKVEEYISDFGKGYKRKMRKTYNDDGTVLIEHLDLVEWDGKPV